MRFAQSLQPSKNIRRESHTNATMGPNGAVNSVISVNGNGNYLYSGSTGVDRLFIFLAPHSSKTPQPISIKLWWLRRRRDPSCQIWLLYV